MDFENREYEVEGCKKKSKKGVETEHHEEDGFVIGMKINTGFWVEPNGVFSWIFKLKTVKSLSEAWFCSRFIPVSEGVFPCIVKSAMQIKLNYLPTFRFLKQLTF